MRIESIFLILTVVIISSCQGNGDDNQKDDSLNITNKADTASFADNNENEKQDSIESNEESTPKKELKELKQVTFCDCVKKQEAINKQLEEAETDDQINAALALMDEIENGECKNLLAGNTDSPSKRAEHKRKVAECLNK